MVHALLLLVALLLSPTRAWSQDQAVAGAWEGLWTAPEGWLYAAEMHLTVESGNAVRGYITWTLKKSPRPEEQSRIGLTGVEFVRGTFDSGCGVLRMEGYRLDDPAQILGLDRYVLIIAETGRTLGGITWHHGPWTGQFLVNRL